MTDQKAPPGCPMCRMALRHIGRLIAFTDQAGKHFAFAVCAPCSSRLDRLPINVQKRQLEAAVFQLSRYPKRYQYREFSDRDAAYLFVSLEAARLRGDL